MKGDLISVYKYLKGGGRQADEARLSSVVHSNRTRSSGSKFEYRKFHKICRGDMRNATESQVKL